MTDKTSNYVAAWMDWNTDKIVVLERDQDGKLHRVRYNPPYYFYVPDEDGEYESIFGDKLTRAEFDSRDHYEAAKRQFSVKFESDIPPLRRVLMDEYYDRPAPPINYAFLDIEVDYSQKIGFAGPMNPYAPINAITIYQSWTKEYLTYVVPPSEFRGSVKDLNDKIASLVKEKKLRDGVQPKIVICGDEIELLHKFVAAIAEADIISGWNSEFFDVPYICERLLLAGGEPLLMKLDVPGVPKAPKKEMVNRYGSEEPVWKLTGRSHLDYMRLFQKFTFEGRVSYALGNILEEEVKVGKLEYDGTLEQLYHNDFPTFVAYNFRDVDGIVQLDSKFKFIALTNQMAHENTVHFDSMLGTVAYVETGIANHAHYKLNKIVHDKKIQENEKVEGAVVLNPNIGLHMWLGSVDINSLYPNTIRSLNISPEMIIGQFDAGEDAWRAIRNGTDARLCFTIEGGEQHIATAAEWKAVLTEQKWAISAYGTVFDQGKGKGVVADILGYWYSERKRLQAEKKKWAKKVEQLPAGPEKEEAKRQEDHYDLLQLTKKISMNSLYGALLNMAFRFGDERMGASVTASGRAITTHMIETIGEALTGKKHKLDKRFILDVKTSGNGGQYVETIDHDIDKWLTLPSSSPIHSGAAYKPLMLEGSEWQFSDCIIYGDTDSCYYRCVGATDKDTAIKIADDVADTVNKSFPAFMREAFNCQEGFDGLISAGREIVGIRGLFQAKKKYMVKIVDKEGFAPAPGKDMKTQGSEIKKADTPKIIQKFIKTTVDMILDGKSYDEVADYVIQQRSEIIKKKDNLFLLGVAKQVNNLETFLAEYNAPGSMRAANGNKLTIPGHVRAALNYNSLLNIFDKGSKPIRAGDKVLVFHLKPNQHRFESIAFPAEFTKFPKWFTENFAVDLKTTEHKMFDKKLKGIFEAIKKDVPSPQTRLTNSILEF